MGKLLSVVKNATPKFPVAAMEGFDCENRVYGKRLGASFFSLFASCSNWEILVLFHPSGPLRLARPSRCSQYGVYMCLSFAAVVNTYSYYVVSAVIKGQPTRAE